jgi:iron-sulfur cluster repair protein YtfE (RIC family)
MSETILQTLRLEHRQIEVLMEKIDASMDIAQKKEMYLMLKDELMLHMLSEEKTLYAHLEQDVAEDSAGDLAQQADLEHQEVKTIIEQLDNTGIETLEWEMLFQKLKEKFLYHFHKEEEVLFAEAKEDFSREDLEEFADEFQEVKHQLENN